MKFYLLTIFTTLFLAASAEVKPFRKHLAHQGKLAAPGDTMDITLDEKWNKVMPKIEPRITINDEKFKAKTVYQLTCESMSSGPYPSEYNVHYYAGDKPLGFYNVKPALKATEFTANQQSLIDTKHLVLEDEGAPRSPFNLMIMPSKADSYTCVIEVPSKKHPYYAFSEKPAVQTPSTRVDINVGVEPWPTENIDIVIPWP